MKKLFALSLLLLIVAGGTFLVFSGSVSTKEVLAGVDVVVEITDQGYSPERIIVSRGDQVAWVNRSSEYRWPASNVHPSHEIYSAFDPQEPLAPGETWVFTFERVGEWRCHDHLLVAWTCIVVVTK